MRYMALGVLVCGCLSLGTPAHAQTADPQIVAPINKFVEAFNKGDAAGAAATMVADDDLVIIDEVAPFAWRGAQALPAWGAALERHDKAAGITDQKVTVGAATRVETEGDTAYVIVPATYTFTQKGVAMHESAQMTVVLKKVAGAWMIHGWTWTGPTAKPVGAAAR